MGRAVFQLAKKLFYGVYDIAPGACLEIYDYYQVRKMKRQSPALQQEMLEPKADSILVDITETSRTDVNTGIQRVVKNILSGLLEKNNSKIIPACVWGDTLTTVPIGKKKISDKPHAIKFGKPNKILLLDLSLNCFPYYKKLLSLKQEGLSSYMVVYDLFPIQYPELFAGSIFVDKFTRWIKLGLEQCDNIVCISKTVADNVCEYYRKNGNKRKKELKLYYFPMGANIISHAGPVRETLKEFIAGNGCTFLMVGTVEPRKGHKTVLEAMEFIQSENGDIGLLILGRNGWKNNTVVEKIRKMQQSGKRILWLEDASDAEVSWAYQNTAALIAASKDEGFGLPLIEAAYYGLPIICSDIPIFHEVAGDNATYFGVLDEQALRNTLRFWMNSTTKPGSHQIRISSWPDSASELQRILDGKAEPYIILK